MRFSPTPQTGPHQFGALEITLFTLHPTPEPTLKMPGLDG